MALRFAFIGFRHAHIFGLYEAVKRRSDTQLVAACEDNAAGRKALPDTVEITHTDHHQMLDEVECDVIAVGDYYGRRGSLLIEALRRGKHVIADKPICTRLSELSEIEKLADEKKLAVGCQLDMINSPNMRLMQKLVADGRLGKVHQIVIGGQHPLSYGSRPMWYFEQGKHGGTFNDIAIHAIHALPWLTGQQLDQCVAARTWNAFAVEQPHFPDSAQAMLTLTGGCGVLIDVSYAMPAGVGYKMPQYWRTTLFGSKGVAETASAMDHVWFAEAGKTEPQILNPDRDSAGFYLDAYIDEINGTPRSPLTTREIIAASRQCLRIQEATDAAKRDVKL